MIVRAPHLGRRRVGALELVRRRPIRHCAHDTAEPVRRAVGSRMRALPSSVFRRPMDAGSDTSPRDSTPEGPAVRLVDAVAVLGKFPVLAGASIEVARGEIVLLRGPNGAGKTSLLRLCAGLLPLVRGRGEIFGLDVVAERELVRARVGMLGHRNGLYADLTVIENIQFWGATVGATDDEVAESATRLAVDGRLRDVQVAKLSAGQKRRTALACLIARRAELWLLDEPHAGLDADGRDELDAVLRQAVDSGATVLVASHELERAGSLADRVVDVTAGQVSETLS